MMNVAFYLKFNKFFVFSAFCLQERYISKLCIVAYE